MPFTILDLLDEEIYNLSGNVIINYLKEKYDKREIECEYGISRCRWFFLTDDDLIPICGLAILELSHWYFNYP